MAALLISVHCFRMPDGKVTNWQQISPFSLSASFCKNRSEIAVGLGFPRMFTLLMCSGKMKMSWPGWKIPNLVLFEPCTISQLTWVRDSFPASSQVMIIKSLSRLRLTDILLLEMPVEKEKADRFILHFSWIWTRKQSFPFTHVLLLIYAAIQSSITRQQHNEYSCADID